MGRLTVTAMLAAAGVTAMLTTVTASADIRWIERDHDFGLMKEVAGPVTAFSRFVNAGPDTVSVFSVKPSCGCTSADFDDRPLAPGDTAVISYTYDPAMRPGKFEKSVKVRLSDGTRHSIRITGNVLGTPESLATLFPVDAGAMRLSDGAVNAGEVVFGRAPVNFISAYSLPLDSITASVTSDSPGISVKPSQPKAGPGDVLTYAIAFNSARHGQYGPVEIPIRFVANPSAQDSGEVTIRFSAFVVPDRDALLMRQKNKIPACSLPAAPVSLGTARDSAEGVITITNTGWGPLHVLSVSAAGNNVTPGKLPREIKPGKSARVSVKADLQTLPDGAFRIPVDIVTDDPDHPHQQISLTGEKTSN